MRKPPAERRRTPDATAKDRRLLVTTVCFAVPLLAFFAALNGYGVSAEHARQFPDAYATSRAERRLAAVIARLPATARIGYITDLDPSNPAYSAALLATQYALAPRQLFVAGQVAVPLEWAVGVFERRRDVVSAGAASGYDVVSDMGNGFVLYRLKSAK